MSRLYGEQHRKLQDDFGTRGMADRVEDLVCRTEFDDGAKGFMEKVRDSRYVPREDCETPLAGWKQIDLVQDILNDTEAKKAKEIGIIPIEEWVGKIISADEIA